MNMLTQHASKAIGFLFALALFPGTVWAQLIITPAEGILDGNSLFRPFNNPQPGRFQQVYDAASFDSLPPGGGNIHFVLFRVDPFAESFSAGINSLQINLSTTPRGTDQLSPVFDENTGPNDRIVLGPTSVGIGGSGGGGLSTFDVFFTLAQPFHYDPAMGNLLLDFRIFAGAGTNPGRIATLDAFDVAGDGVSSVYAYGSTMPTVGQVSSLGLATAFSITPVPEPSSVALFTLGLVLLAGVYWKRMGKRKEASRVAA